MSIKWRPTARTIRIAGTAAVITVIAIYVVSHLDSGPKTPDEFFSRNTHLSRSQSRIDAEALPNRAGDQFIEGDYQLKNKFSYPIKVSSTMKLGAMKKLIIDTGFDGMISLHSFGVKDKNLMFIAEFKLDQLKGIVKLSPEIIDQLGLKARDSKFSPNRSLLVNMDPAGVVKSISSNFSTPNDSATELRVNLLLTMFRRLPPFKTGSSSRMEPDENGLAFKMDYLINQPAPKQLGIKGSAVEKRTIGASPKKAAAAGAPNLSLAGLENNQDQSFNFIWDTENQVPNQQKFSGSTSMTQFGQTISSSETSVTLQWSPAVAHSLDTSLQKLFSFPVDFKRFGRLGTERVRPMQALAKKDLLGRSYADILKQMNSMEKMSDTQRDQLFVEYAKALRRDRSLLPAVKEKALNATPDSRERSMALGALGFEGSPEAQAAMIEVYKTSNATLDEKQKVMTELTICTEPLSASTKGFLGDEFKSGDPLSSDLAAGAGLALGSSIARDGDVTTIQLLKNEWSSQSKAFGSGPSEVLRKEFLLSAMGNSKSDAFADQVKTSINSSNPSLRSAAVNSLRFAQDTKSRELLQKSLSQDPNADVQVQAAQAMRYQPFDSKTEEALKTCAGNTDLGVKLECYRVLAARIQQPGVRSFLQSRLSSESEVQVKGLLQQVLTIEE